jgi:hypothetical protein
MCACTQALSLPEKKGNEITRGESKEGHTCCFVTYTNFFQRCEYPPSSTLLATDGRMSELHRPRIGIDLHRKYNRQLVCCVGIS